MEREDKNMAQTWCPRLGGGLESENIADLMMKEDLLKELGHNQNSMSNIYTYGLPYISVVRNLPANAGNMDLIPRSERSLEKETHSSILAWEIPWTMEPGGLWSMWS